MSDAAEPTDASYPLSPEDADALDALVDASFDADGVDPSRRDRARRLAEVLALLEADNDALNQGRGDLIVRTLDRTKDAPSVAHNGGSRGPASSAAPGPSLGERDREAVDVLAEHAWRSPDSNDPRLGRAAALLGTLSVDPLEVDPPSVRERRRRDLIERTLVRIQDAPGRGRLAPAVDPFGPSNAFRVRDAVVAAAAMILLMLVAWPAVSSMRSEARRQICQANLGNAYVGFRMFANDFDGRLPHASLVASPEQRSQARSHVHHEGCNHWWHVGDPMHSHSANLFAMVASGHAELEHLACPGNPMAPTRLASSAQLDWRSPDQVSFSYQRSPGPVPIRIRFGRTSEGRPFPIAERIVLLADRSPVADRLRRGERFDPQARSIMHKGRGQNLLYNDGVVEFLRSPSMPDGDNIWLPASVERSGVLRLEGGERPSDEKDAFVG